MSPLRGMGNELVTRHMQGTWEDLPARQLPAVAAVLAESHADALAAVKAHAEQRGELLVLGAGRGDAEVREELLATGFTLVSGDEITPPSSPRAPEEGRLWLMTSGSTGRAKRLSHSFDSLTTVTGSQPPRRWLCAYSPGTYAWWQLVTLALSHPDQGLVCVEGDDVSIWPEVAAREGVTAISGTPTFWRHGYWRAGARLGEIPLRQATLGGEPVDQQVLDTLRRLFPDARVSWIYASSEAGASIAVHDGVAGFPVEWLDRAHHEGRPRLSVVHDELLIVSPHHAVEHEGTIHTGDRVEVVDGRVHITGRLGSDEINVGGSKIAAATVRDVLLGHPTVVWAAVKERRAPIVGRVVAANVVVDSPTTEQDLIGWCTDRLPDYGVPRQLRILDEIPIKETLKSDV